MSSSVPSGQVYTAPRRQIWAWALGGVANHLLICTYGHASAIFTIGFGLNAALVSWAIMLPRLIDGITDPILGHISDNTHTRWGRRKPYLIIGSVLGAIFLAALYWVDPGWSDNVKLIYLFVLGTLFYCSWGLYSMAWTAIGYELSDAYHERSRIAAIGSLFLSVVLLVHGGTYWMALRPLFHHGVLQTANEIYAAGLDWPKVSSILYYAFVGEKGAPTNVINGIRWLSGIMGLVAIVSAIITTCVCRERFGEPSVRKPHMPMLRAIRTTASNRPFLILLLIKLCQTLGERAAGGIMVYVAMYYACQGDQALATQISAIGSGIGVVFGFATVPFIEPVSRLLGKKGALCLSASVSLIASVITPFALTPVNPYWMLVPALIGATVGALSNTIFNAIMPDICDVDEMETGQRREGLFTAVMGFVAKIEISLCTLLVGYMVVWAGLDTRVALQPPEVLNWLFWLAVIPNIVFTTGYLLLAMAFPMTAAYMESVRRTLEARRMAEAESEEPESDGTALLVDEPTDDGRTVRPAGTAAGP